jgi:Tfp pilus assembly protein PilV
MRTTRATLAGMALLEIVTALTIISVGLLGVVQMYQIGIDQIRQSQRRMAALRAIDDEIESLRALPLAERPAGENVPWHTHPVAFDLLVEPHATLNVAPYSSSPDLTQVTVRLQWYEGRRRVSREVVTLLGAAP